MQITTDLAWQNTVDNSLQAFILKTIPATSIKVRTVIDVEYPHFEDKELRFKLYDAERKLIRQFPEFDFNF